MRKQVAGVRWQTWLVLIGIVALAVNLRPGAVSIGPLLDEITTELRMSAPAAGVLTALPVICFATVGAIAPQLAQRFGIHRLTLLSLIGLVAGLVARSFTHSALAFLALSFLAMAGMAAANVIMPSLVKFHFPRHIGLLTGIYTTAMAGGLTAASIITVPIAHHDGELDWRRGLLVWAFVAAVAAVPWLFLVRHDRSIEPPARTIRLVDVARTRLGLLMALFFGLQSLQAYTAFGWVAQIYRDAGFSPTVAGLLLGIVTGVGIPLSFVVPVIAARNDRQTGLLITLMACYPIALIGLMVAPTTAPWLWATTLGIGLCTFPLILTLINLRARTTAGTAALSGFTQSAGYLIASIGPIGTGVLYDITGGWTVPLLVLLLLAGAQFLSGLALSRPDFIEDHLPNVE